MTSLIAEPPQLVVDALLRAALAEDLATAGDVTTNSVIPAGATARARIVARQRGVVAGLAMGVRAFGLLDERVAVDLTSRDGDLVAPGTALARVEGPVHPILAAERTCLNLLGHLSGIATATHRVVGLIEHTRARIADTRKTTPGLRALEKYAVRTGGGANHRFGLFDAVLIKDNHLAVAGGVAAAVAAAREGAGHTVKIEVEIDDVSQLEAAIAAGADAVLLDNMDPEELAAAVAVAGGRCLLEASGGITPETVVAVAETGVDLVSLGWITHSAPRWDVALDFDAL